MRLLVCITTQTEKTDAILGEMMRLGLCGATTLDGNGMLKSLNESNIDPPPIFGSLRQFIHPGNENVKVFLIVLKEADIPTAKKVIYQHLGDLSKPNTGILFEIPIENAEGIAK